ncbi:MAG: desulfoferrodoxin [Pirellulales bacterium]|nr:desulfoferrodoxin [Pirellulales bacterium]
MKRRDFLSTVGLGAAAASLPAVAMAAEDEKEEKKSRRKYPKEARSQIYYCEICGTVAEILEPGRAPIVHCGVPMKLLEEMTDGVEAEKHVPVIEKIDGGYKVTVGRTVHPMTRSHFIGFIDLVADGRVLRQYLEPGGEPVATFLTDAKDVSARAWCNLHGLWKSK